MASPQRPCPLPISRVGSTLAPTASPPLANLYGSCRDDGSRGAGQGFLDIRVFGARNLCFAAAGYHCAAPAFGRAGGGMMMRTGSLAFLLFMIAGPLLAQGSS